MANSGGQISCCCFDLETTSLNADFGVLLCAVVKGAGKPAVVLRGDKLSEGWAKGRSDDRAVVQATVEELAKHDIWCAHNGARFDVPFLRTRLLQWGLPPLPLRKLVDPVLLARNKLRLSFNSLKQVANHLRCNSKTDLAPGLWLKASLDGDTDAMNYIVKHCVADVKTLEHVLSALKDYCTTINSYGSGF